MTAGLRLLDGDVGGIRGIPGCLDFFKDCFVEDW